jgi:hypothetical protein
MMLNRNALVLAGMLVAVAPAVHAMDTVLALRSKAVAGVSQVAVSAKENGVDGAKFFAKVAACYAVAKGVCKLASAAKCKLLAAQKVDKEHAGVLTAIANSKVVTCLIGRGCSSSSSSSSSSCSSSAINLEAELARIAHVQAQVVGHLNKSLGESEQIKLNKQ